MVKEQFWVDELTGEIRQHNKPSGSHPWRCYDSLNNAREYATIIEKRVKEEKKLEKERKKSHNDNRQDTGKSKFHGIYCLLIGWWLATFLICCIVPLFFKGGRKLIKKAFGIW